MSEPRSTRVYNPVIELARRAGVRQELPRDFCRTVWEGLAPIVSRLVPGFDATIEIEERPSPTVYADCSATDTGGYLIGINDGLLATVRLLADWSWSYAVTAIPGAEVYATAKPLDRKLEEVVDHVEAMVRNIADGRTIEVARDQLSGDAWPALMYLGACRVVIAHEVGHVALRHHAQLARPRRDVEDEADEFASRVVTAIVDLQPRERRAIVGGAWALHTAIDLLDAVTGDHDSYAPARKRRETVLQGIEQHGREDMCDGVEVARWQTMLQAMGTCMSRADEIRNGRSQSPSASAGPP